jgi:ketosteroid isomerase-like protein
MTRLMITLAVATVLTQMAEAQGEDVKAAADRFDQAQQAGDGATLERMLADDLVFVRMTGVVAGKKEFITTFAKSPAVTLEPFQITNKTFVPLGDRAAIIGGEARVRGTRDGKPFAQHFLYSDTFLFDGGEWKVVHVQVTPVP